MAQSADQASVTGVITAQQLKPLVDNGSFALPDNLVHRRKHTRWNHNTDLLCGVGGATC